MNPGISRAILWPAAWWVGRRRARHRPGAVPFSTEAVNALAPFFPAETMASALVRVVPRIPAPIPLRLARRIGIRTVDFDRVLGITYADTILIAERVKGSALLATLFHELVHVEQFRQLGLSEFVRRYITGWWKAGRRYEAIPLEREAYELQRRFEKAPGEPFDVAAEVARRSA